MNFTNYLSNAFRTLLFREDSIKNISRERISLFYGFLVLVTAGITTALYSFNIVTILLNIVYLFIFVIVGFLFYHYVAVGFFEGQANILDYAQVFIAPFIVFWLAIIPVIGIFVQVIGALLIIILNIFFLRKVHNLSVTKAIILGILPIILLIAYVIIVGPQNVSQ